MLPSFDYLVCLDGPMEGTFHQMSGKLGENLIVINPGRWTGVYGMVMRGENYLVTDVKGDVGQAHFCGSM